MISNISITRFIRFIKKDNSLPKTCYNKWLYNDITISCSCNHICEYKNYTQNDWYTLANKYYLSFTNKK